MPQGGPSTPSFNHLVGAAEQRQSLKARAHYAQAIADTGTDLTVQSPIRHRTDRLR
jgi:hypothetical protein